MPPKYRFLWNMPGSGDFNADYNEDFYVGYGVVSLCRPLWNNGLAMEWNKESGYEFFRRALSGELTFIGADYDTILAQAFDTEFNITAEITYDGTTWTPYWRGKFFKTDCKFDEGRVTVNPTADDEYAAILKGLDKEFDLVSLAPEIHRVRYYKRPVLQLYVAGETVISNFVGQLWWEAECEAILSGTDLVNTYKFDIAYNRSIYQVSGAVNIQMRSYSDAGYLFEQNEESGPYGDYWVTQLTRTDDGARWYLESNPGDPQPSLPVTLNADTDTPATGQVIFAQTSIYVYGRIITDSLTVGGYNTTPIPVNDMCDHGTYSRVIGFTEASTLYLWDGLSSDPTEWGLYQPGLYYTRPAPMGMGDLVPVGRTTWGNLSLWFSSYIFLPIYDQSGRTAVWLNDAYPIWSVLNVLIDKLDPTLDFQCDEQNSEILSGQDPIGGFGHYMFLTPKTNILKSGYDQPARSAKTTLRKILDMLWKTMRCVWWIENGIFRIEHISYLMNGGAYSGTPTVGLDLTSTIAYPVGKPVATGQNAFSYNRPEMPQRYEFGWGDKVSSVFEGMPVDMVSKYVGEAIEKITVEEFNSDIDYMLANPSACSQDGFALLDTITLGDDYAVSMYGYPEIQNYRMSFESLWVYYTFDLPCPKYRRGGGTYTSDGQKRYKTSDVKFPALTDPNVVHLIKTNIGNGQIEKLSINLSSRAATATLNYDTD